MRTTRSSSGGPGAGEFEFVAVLEEHYPTIRAELERLDLERDFIDWPTRAAYSGSWRVFPLFFPGAPYLPVDARRNRALCPATARILQTLHGMQGAGFSLLGPLTCVHAHRDHYAQGVVRCHLGLRVPAGACLRIANSELCWEEGRCLVFDGQTEHEAINPTSEARIVLLADFSTGAGALDQAPA